MHFNAFQVSMSLLLTGFWEQKHLCWLAALGISSLKSSKQCGMISTSELVWNEPEECCSAWLAVRDFCPLPWHWFFSVSAGLFFFFVWLRLHCSCSQVNPTYEYIRLLPLMYNGVMMMMGYWDLVLKLEIMTKGKINISYWDNSLNCICFPPKRW